jgi:hypothetical protein
MGTDQADDSHRRSVELQIATSLKTGGCHDPELTAGDTDGFGPRLT